MFIDSDNFEELKERILQEIHYCEFIAFDLELTGVKSDLPDTFEELVLERYLKMRKTSMKYNIIQFGLSLFMKLPQCYQTRTYTIYILPQSDKDVVSLQIGAVAFNNEQGMDWNRWLRKGVSYLNESAMAKLGEERQAFSQQKAKQDLDQLMKEQKLEDKEVIEELIAQVAQFAASQLAETTIPTKNSYHRKIIYLQIEVNYDNIVGEAVKGQQSTKLQRITAQEKEKRNLLRQQDQETKRNTQVGFTAIWNAIVESKKPLVGHNCFVDLMFVYSHMVECPPLSCDTFKKELLGRLPVVYDTKFIFLNAPSLQKLREQIDTSSSVENLHEFLKKTVAQVQIEFQMGVENLENYHTAGYDAQITGSILLHLIQGMGEQEKYDMQNQLYLYKSIYAMNLMGKNRKLVKESQLFVRLPFQKQTQQHQQNDFRQKKLQFEKEQNLVDQVLDKYKLKSKLIHFRYLYITVKEHDFKKVFQELKELIEKALNQCHLLTEAQYEEERKAEKEANAKMEQFDRRS